MTLFEHCILLSEKLCHLNLESVNNLSGIGWHGVDLAEISASPNGPEGVKFRELGKILF
jgi:hypothetical protein